MARNADVFKRLGLAPHIERGFRFSPLALSALLALSTFQAVALAADPSTPALQLQQGTIDDTKRQAEMLNGNIERTEVLDANPSGESKMPKSSDLPTPEGQQAELSGDAQQAAPMPRTIILDGSQQDLSEAINNATSLFKLFLGKSGFNPVVDLGKREPQLSPEEYRKMEYGVIGLDAVLQIGGPGPIVTRVFPGTPAETAGIQKGDLIVKAKDHVFKPGEGQRVLWQIVAGRAGTPVDISVLRNGEVMKFHMLRMNIEDIPDKNKRRNYELLLSTLGAPHYDADGDLADSALKDKNELDALGRFVSKKKIILKAVPDDE